MITSKDLIHWLHPWPIRLPRQNYKLLILPIWRCERLFAFWKVNGKYRSIAWWADRAADYKAPCEQHYIHMLARDRIPTLSSLTIIVLRREGKNIVIDGNHQLIALALVRRHGFHGRKALIKHVGILMG